MFNETSNNYQLGPGFVLRTMIIFQCEFYYYFNINSLYYFQVILKVI